MTVVRPAQLDDLPGVMAVWCEVEGLGLDHPPLPLYRHELETGAMVVADDDGTIVGFGATLERGGRVFLADLFVHPDRQSEGLGKAIVEALFELWPSAPRYTNASADPRAQRLYERMGMRPRFWIDYLTADRPPSVRADLHTVMGPVDDDTMARQREWTGIDRSVDLAYWAQLGARVVTVLDSEPIGHGFVFPHTPWSPFGDRLVVAAVVAASGSDAGQVTTAVFAAAAEFHDRAERVLALVPQPHPAHSSLIAGGMVVVDSDLFMASDGAEFDPTRRTAAPDIN